MTRGDILLVHGAFAGSWVFENLRMRLSRQGWKTHAPDLPFHDPGFAGKEPHPDLPRQGLAEYRRFLAAEIARLPQPPVLVGHSLGGLLAQQLATEGLARAAILLAPSPPWGVWPHSRTEVETAFGLLWHSHDLWRKAVQPDYATAIRYSMDRLPPALQRDSFARLVPESGRALFETIHWWLDWQAASRVSAYRVQVPLLLLVGSDDKVNSPGTCRAIARRYGRRATYREIADMSHFIFGEPGEARVTDIMLDWLESTAA